MSGVITFITPNAISIRPSTGEPHTMLLDDLLNYKIVKEGQHVNLNQLLGYVINPNQNHSTNGHQVQSLVVLTVPHAKCSVNLAGHNCDTSASPFARMLEAKLIESGRNVVTMYGDINRLEVDLNRVEARYTDFRVKVRKAVVGYIEKMNGLVFVLDCHSFPDKRGYSNVRISNPDVMLLFDNVVNFVNIFELMELLREKGIVVILVPGVRNDIIDEFNMAVKGVHVVSVLIEVNESMSDSKLDVVCSVVDVWIGTIG